MRWNSGATRSGAAQAVLIAAGLVLLLAAAPSAEKKRLAIFAPQASYTVPIFERQGREYVDIVELLRRLGQVTTTDNHGKWSISLGSVEGQFENGQDRARIRERKIPLGADFLGGGGAALLPLRGVAAVLAGFLDTRVDYHEGARRVFIGNTGTHFTTELRRSGERSSLVVKFSAPVNPTISTEPGALHMIFTRDPVVATAEHIGFDDKLIAGATYSEGDGISQLTVNGTAPLMAQFADGARTIIISGAPTMTVAAAPPPAAPATETPPTPATEAPAVAAVPPPPGPGTPRPRFLVVIDPAHGGDETGVAFSPKLLEKDLTLSLGRRLRAELESRGVTAILLRDGDVAIAADQRAAIANADRAAVYIALHAGAPGPRVRVYTAMLPPAGFRPGAFLPWQTAQAAYLDLSGTLAEDIVGELNKHQIGAAWLPGPVRPLNNIAAAAVAVEISPADEEAEAMADPKYQQSVAAAVAGAVAAARAGLEGAR